MLERRQYIRIETPVSLTHRIEGSLLGASSDSVDISVGGVSFPSVQKLDPGIILNLDISLPGFKQPVTARGKVVWQNDNDNLNTRFMVGAEFININSSDRGRITNYVYRALAENSRSTKG